jgi:hypothetical protein
MRFQHITAPNRDVLNIVYTKDEVRDTALMFIDMLNAIDPQGDPEAV